jgi:hypothetical protein
MSFTVVNARSMKEDFDEIMRQLEAADDNAVERFAEIISKAGAEARRTINTKLTGHNTKINKQIMHHHYHASLAMDYILYARQMPEKKLRTQRYLQRFFDLGREAEGLVKLGQYSTVRAKLLDIWIAVQLFFNSILLSFSKDRLTCIFEGEAFKRLNLRERSCYTLQGEIDQLRIDSVEMGILQTTGVCNSEGELRIPERHTQCNTHNQDIAKIEKLLAQTIRLSLTDDRRYFLRELCKALCTSLVRADREERLQLKREALKMDPQSSSEIFGDVSQEVNACLSDIKTTIATGAGNERS